MNNALLHAMNKTSTHIDVEHGEFISLPKEPADKPPVNADINGLIIYGKSTQDGEPTAENPVDPVDIPPEFNLTVCGKNLFNHRNNSIVNGSIEIIDDYVRCTGNINEGASEFAFSRGTYRPNFALTQYNQPVLKLGDTITISADIRLVENRHTPYIRFYIDSLNAGQVEGKFLITSEWQRISHTQTIHNEALVNNLDKWYPTFALNSNIVDIKNIAIKYGTDGTYTPYTGNTYPYRLEDLDGTLHELCSLPDGTADTYNRETGELIKKVKINTFENATGWRYVSINDTLAWVGYTDADNQFDSQAYTNNIRCTIATPVLTPTAAGQIRITKSTAGSNMGITVLKSELISLNNTGAQAWITAHCPFTVMYELATPQIYKIKQYGKTYGEVVWEYNEKPKSIQYHTNIFTDVGAEMQCEVRKLGNRAMGTFNWVTENGDKIITEDEDYIMFEY